MLWEQLVNGLTMGSAYALIALGYTMVYGIVQLINFAHGEVYMIGAFVGLFLVTVLGLNVFAGILGAMLFCALLGMLIERLAYRPLRRASRLSALISAIGVSMILSTVMVLIRGPGFENYPESAFPMVSFTVASVSISSLQILILVTAALLMIGLQILVHKTKIGLAMRACAQDVDAATLMGVNVDRVIAITFGIGSALAAAGGVLVGLNWGAVQPYMGMQWGLKAFAAAILGGIGSIPGAMIGGMLLGILETFGIAFLASSYKDAFAFGILILVLIVRPQGLLGKPVIKKV
ncbi:MAG: branched-chain amino acid ABC transporter permease [Solirubrobacterales bacterium]